MPVAQRVGKHFSATSGSHGGEYEDGCLLTMIALMMEAASTSETSVIFYQTTRRNNPEDIHLQVFLCSSGLLRLRKSRSNENLKFYIRQKLGTSCTSRDPRRHVTILAGQYRFRELCSVSRLHFLAGHTFVPLFETFGLH
jgi:hypothetical protein